jgi:hypothetical protein
MEKQGTSAIDSILDGTTGLKPDETPEQGKESSISSGVNANKTVSDSNVKITKVGDSDYEYIAGFKFALVTAAVTMVAFLIALDANIVVTVSSVSSRFNPGSPVLTRSGYSKDHQRLPFHSRYWLLWCRLSFGEVSSTNTSQPILGAQWTYILQLLPPAIDWQTVHAFQLKNCLSRLLGGLRAWLSVMRCCHLVQDVNCRKSGSGAGRLGVG